MYIVSLTINIQSNNYLHSSKTGTHSDVIFRVHGAKHGTVKEEGGRDNGTRARPQF